MARLFLVPGQTFGTVGGFSQTAVIGTNSDETVFLTADAKADFDPSFNRGGDTINIGGIAELYQASRVGSSLLLTATNGAHITVPAGAGVTTINFIDAVRELSFQGGKLYLGGQVIETTPAAVAEGDFVGVFTLTEAIVEGEPYVPPQKAVYWGYNPHDHEESPNGLPAPTDGGVPLATLVEFLTTITGLDLAELGLIDDDGVGPFDNVTNLTITNVLEASVDANQDPDTIPYLEITYGDGTTAQFAVEALIADKYFAFLNNLLFDSEGNSRLYEVEIPGTGSGEASTDHVVPILLTPNQNNGGTIETGYTSSADETIVAGRLELLHQAYINGGGGYNTLEVDAKGLYAQPAALINIQEVHVNDLPNFYTAGEGDGYGNDYSSDEFPDAPNSGNDNSWIDLNRALDLQKLVVTDQGRGSSWASDGSYSGDLYIAGVRNGATLRLEGGFTSGRTTIAYGQGQNGVLNLELAVGNVAQDINILQNASVLNILSDGVANHLENFFGGGQLLQMVVTGTGYLHVDNDLNSTFDGDAPNLIDASGNTGGVDLTLTGSQNVTILGSQASDRFVIGTRDIDGGPFNDETVDITGGAGNNYYQITGADKITISNGDGNNNYEVISGESPVSLLTITTGNGNNHFEIDQVATAILTAGSGNNRIDISSANSFDHDAPPFTPDYLSDITVVAGNGKNIIHVEALADGGSIDITVGNGGNQIVAAGGSVDITTAGAASNTIYAYGETVTIDNAASNGSTIVLGGASRDFYQIRDELGGNDPDGEQIESAPDHRLDDGALLNVQAGSGAVVALGIEGNENNGVTLTALPGSVIAGQNLTLAVNTVADLRAATLTGISRVLLDDDNFNVGDATSANEAVAGGNASVLVLTDEQFLAIGAGNIDVDGAIFNTHAFVKIIVTNSTSLTALGVNDLPRNVDLILEIQDGVTLSMTAEQLHTRVAQNGVTLVNDGNTDVGNGKVVITGGGVNFDPFNTSDTVQTDIGGVKYYGGSLSDDFKVNGQWHNVTVNSVFGGYDRPADAVAEVVLTINSDITSTVGAFATWHTNLEIVGEQDVNFTGAVQLNMGLASTGPGFSIDFSALEGEVVNFVVDNFEQLAQGGGIWGNGSNGYDAEVLVSIAADDTMGNGDFNAPNAGWDETGAKSLVSKGVNQYTVVQIDGPTTGPGSTATIKLSDVTQDLDVIALRGNYNDTLVIQNAAWGLGFELQGGGTAKAEGPTTTSNVGALVANYQWPGAEAVVDIVHSVAGDPRTIYAAGITIENAASLTVNALEGDVIVHDIAGGAVTSLVLTGAGDVTVEDWLPDQLTSIDASGVVGDVSLSIEDPVDNSHLTIVGAQGGSTLILSDVQDGDIASISGAGPVTLIVSGEVDLDLVDLDNVVQVILGQDAELSLTVDQADAIGAGNFVLAPGADAAELNLAGLGEQPFTLAAYAPGISVDVVSIVDQPVVTLHSDTDLTGINALAVPEGVTLNLTAAQFQQLGNGSITIIDTDGNPANDAINVNITDLTQADVPAGPGIDFTVNGINVGGGQLTITLAESVVFTDTNVNILTGANGEKATIILGDGLKLTLAEVEQVDGTAIVGGAGSTLEFTDTTGFLVNIDASGFDIDFVRLPALLVSGINVDYLLEGLSSRVTKVVYEGIGDVEGRTQNVVVEEGVTIFGDISFNEYLLDTEVTHITVDLNGGTRIDGDIVLSTVQVNAGDIELVPYYLQQVVINSTGTAGNTINGNTDNVIVGDITPAAYGPAVGLGSRDNQLKSVVINADQALVVKGDIVFSSHGSDPEGSLSNEPLDQITANDDNAATATLVVNGTADVTLGTLDVSDGDVDFLHVVNNGTGTLSATLDGALLNAEDTFSFTGAGDIDLAIEGSVNLASSVIDAVSSFVINDGGSLSITQAQLTALGVANIVDGETPGSGALTIVGYDGSPIAIPPALAPLTVTLTTTGGSVTVDPGADFTNVDQINVPAGGTLTLTAAQFQQLAGSGSIDAISGSINIVITGLTQADVDAGFSLADVNVGPAGSVTITLGEASVDLGTFNPTTLALVPGSDAVIITDNGVMADFILTDGQTLGLVNQDLQADGLDVTGTGTTTIIYKFIPDTVPAVPGNQIDASGYDVTFLRTVAAGWFPGQLNPEFSLDDLPNGVTLVLYEDPAALGYLDETFRNVIIEEGITTPAGLIFSDWDSDDEVRTLTLTLGADRPLSEGGDGVAGGGTVLNGNLSIPTRTDKDGPPLGIQQFFDALYLNSVGAATNTINGDINTVTVLGPPNTSENNLLNIFIDAQQDLVINGGSAVIDNDGGIFFNSVALTPVSTALLDITGSGDVTIDDIDVSDAGILALTIDLTGFTGVLDPDLIVGGGTETVTITNGDVTAGTAVFQNVDDRTGADGSISVFDASGFDGTLTIGTASFADTAGGLVDIDDNDFTFTAGNGVTKVMLADSNLSASILPTDDGWNFDFSGAAAGSELRIQWDGNVTPAAGSVLNIDMGPDGVLYIDNPTPGSANVIDLTNVNGGLPFFGPLPNSAHPIVLGPNVTLILTAAQANDLHITSAPGVTNSVVNIVGLGDTQVDFSGIDPSVAGVATLEDNDVTLAGDPTVPGGGANATILGAIGILLEDLGGNNSTLQGQTIRFTTVEQAEGHVVYPAHDRFIKVNDTGAAGVSSTNVVWLFDEIPHTLDTGPFIDATPAGPPYNASTHHGYDPAIGRLWLTPELIASASGDVEQLFDTLPSTILRVEFTSSDPLAPLFASLPIDRVVELVHFTDLASGPNATTLFFNDSVGAPTAQGEFIRNLDLRLGGDVALGDIQLGDIVTSADTDLASIEFQALTINSYRAVTGDLTLNPATNETLVSELYNNDNDGNPELGEFAAPDAPNVIGHIGVGGVGGSIPEFDLLTVNIDTHTLRTLNVGNSVVDNNRGEAIVIASITYDSDGADAGDDTAHLNITGANNVTIGFVDTSDAEISNALDINLTGFTAILDPVLHVDNTQQVIVRNDGGPPENATGYGSLDGTAIFQEVEGNELSLFNANGFDGTLIVRLSEIDSTNDDSTLSTPANDGLLPAFTFDSGTGQTTVILSAVGGNTPTLGTGSEWIFDFSDAFYDLGDGFSPDANPLSSDPTTHVAAEDDSSLTIDGSVDFGTGGTLTLIDAATVITGDVDLSTTTLDLTNTGGADKMRFYVGVGSSLTITVDQAIALGGALDVEIVGEGTVYLVGDATDLSGTAIGANLHTAVVDASAVTIDVDGLGGDDDLTGAFELTLVGAFAFDGTAPIGQTVIGSDFDDVLTQNVDSIPDDAELNYHFFGGLGDDTYETLLIAGNNGDFWYHVDAGTDFIANLVGEDLDALGSDAASRNDVLIVEAGATANARVSNWLGGTPPVPGFIATSDTSNAGTANIYEDLAFFPGALIVDLSDAQGPNGYNITGTGNDRLIGSAFADVINGGNDGFGGTVDILTGNAGADQFVFDSQLSSAAQLSDDTVSEVPNVDYELIQLVVDDDLVAEGEGLTLTWNVNGAIGGVIVDVSAVAGDPAALRAAVIAAINTQAGVNAIAGTGAGDVLVRPTGSGSVRDLEITGATAVGGGTFNATIGTEPVLATHGAEDQAQVTTVTVSGTPTNGDVYSVQVTKTGSVIAGGAAVSIEVGVDTPPVASAADIAQALVTALGLSSLAGITVGYTAGDAFFTLTDVIPDDGGFSVELDTDANFAGSGVSDHNLTGLIGDLDTADIITDFNGGEGDTIMFGFPAGTLTSTVGAVADYTAAWGAATGSLTGGNMYHFVSVTDFDGTADTGQLGPNNIEGGGLLFFDANLDGDIDGVLILENVTSFAGGWIA